MIPQKHCLSRERAPACIGRRGLRRRYQPVPRQKGRLCADSIMSIRKSFAAALALCFLGWSAAQAEQYTVALFLAPGDPQGVLRIVNDTGEAATVQVFAIADDGTRTGPATIALGATAAAEFDATELQSANAAKGLSGGLGSFSGDVRLSIDSDAPVMPLAFVRTSDGSLSAMHDTVRPALAEGEPYRYEIPVFNLSTDINRASRLRLINPGDTAAAVTIAGRDDGGAAAAGGDVTLTLPAGGARTLTAQQLEAGGTGLTGRLGAATGGWRLTVSSDEPLQVVNVVASPVGYWNNFSTTAVRGAAAADAAGFDERFVGESLVLETQGGSDSLTIMENGRYSEAVRTADATIATSGGGYVYAGVGPDSGRLTLNYDDGRQCRMNLYFSSRASGWFASHCTGGTAPDETLSGGNWSVGEDEDDGDDHGDTFDTATSVSIPSTTPGEIEEGKEDGDRDYFRVTVAAAGTLTVETTGGVDTYGTLFDGSRTQLATNDDGGSGRNFRISEDVSPGTYYVRVEGYSTRVTGDYTLHVRFAESDSGTTPPGGGQETTHGVGDTLSALPTGSWMPDVTSGGSFSLSGGNVTIRLNDGGYIEEGSYRFTCQSSGGCVIENRSVTSGTVVQTASGTAPGSGAGDTQPSFAADSGPGDQSYIVGTEITALTLPEAGGGDGPLTYSLSPAVPGLTFNATASVRRLTGTPTAAGTYDMTYRVRDTDGDSDSFTFAITVESAGGGGSAVGDFYLHDDNRSPYGIAHANGRLYVVNRDDYKVYVYTVDGQHVAAADFDLHDVNERPTGIAHANGRLYVADWDDEKVYVYTVDGQHVAAADFDLHDDNESPTGIAHANGRLYVADINNNKVYVHTVDGQHVAAADFDLHDDNESPTGIAHANGRLYVVDINNDKVYVHTVDGQHVAAADFYVHDNNSRPWGIAHANGRLYVADINNDKVYVYTVDGQSVGGDVASPRFRAGSGPGNQEYAIGTAISALTLPAASGGDGALTYSLSPEVPGLTFNATVRRLTGTPTAAGSYDMTYRVRDVDGDTDSVSFTISVSETGGTGGDPFTLRITSCERSPTFPFGGGFPWNYSIDGEIIANRALTNVRVSGYAADSGGVITTNDLITGRATSLGTDRLGNMSAGQVKTFGISKSNVPRTHSRCVIVVDFDEASSSGDGGLVTSDAMLQIQ